jgi:hypothetical protein
MIDEDIILADEQNEVPIERDTEGNILAPEGLGHYNVTITCSVIFEDTFAYSAEEAEDLAMNSFYGGGGQDTMDINNAEFEAHLQFDDRKEVQEAYDACWGEEVVAKPRG